MLIERLVVALEMDDGAGRRAAYRREILGEASVNGDGVVGAGGVIGCPGAATIRWHGRNGRKLRLKFRADGDGLLRYSLLDCRAAAGYQK